MDDPYDNLPPEELKRRSAIAYILRRRGRQTKSRANPGTTKRITAEFNNVTLDPSSAHGRWSGFGGCLLGLVSVVLVPALIYAAFISGPPTERHLYWPYAALVGKIFLYVLLVTIVLVVGYVSITALWRIIRSNSKPHL